jgi:hypothetical protein
MLLKQLIALFVANGTTRLYVKRLAENDNPKHGIYLGSGFSAISLLPYGEITAPDGSKEIFHAPLTFYWLGMEGQAIKVPHAKLILYPQYPEVRLSGFLRGSSGAPAALLSSRDSGRLLFLGVTRNDTILAYADSIQSPLGAATLQQLPPAGSQVLDQLSIPSSSESLDRERLLVDLRRIASDGWINSKRLTTDGSLIDCESANCGGYTLEAELGVRPNSQSEPDLYGWEIKQYAVSSFKALLSAKPLTLMTPEPSAGYYAENGPEQFIRQFGYPDKRGRIDRLNFGGLHRFGQRSHLTGLTLAVAGYNVQKERIEENDGAILLLTDTQEVAAAWPFTKVLAHWGRKHAFAAYVPAMRRTSPRRQYRYAPTIFLASRPDPLLLLKAVVAGNVYYDPGLKVENASVRPVTKSRSQFRVQLKHLDQLYHSFEKIALI